MQTDTTDKYTRKLVSICLSGKEESKIYPPARHCLANGADPNVRVKRRSLFSYLIHVGYCRLVALFIRFGADVNAVERKFGLYEGITTVPVIHLTVPGFQREMVDELLQAGADVEAEDAKGRTMVYKAVKLLLDVTMHDSEKLCPEGLSYVSTLVRHGADMFRKDPVSGVSPYELAAADGKERVIAELIDRARKTRDSWIRRSATASACLMKYASKDLYDYANQMPSLKRCIKKSVLDSMNTSSIPAEKIRAFVAADVTPKEIAYFKRTPVYLRNRNKFDSYCARFNAAVCNIEIGTQRCAAEKHRGASEHPIVAAAKEIYAELNRRVQEAERRNVGRTLYDYASEMSY